MASRSATIAASPSECLPPRMPVYLPDRYAVEQLLGAPYGSIVLFDPLTLPDVLRRLHAQARRFGEKR